MATQTGTKPNIILLTLDEMRFPSEFPNGVHSAGEFLAKYMPYTHRMLWEKGVKFSNYQTAAADCTPSRGVMATGLYAQQTWLMLTRANMFNAQSTAAPQPALETAFPTYGKLLREQGYDTPLIGKWHMSNYPAGPTSAAAYDYLEPYGFEGLTMPDPLGQPGQGSGATVASPPPVGADPVLSDANIVAQANYWLKSRSNSGNKKPFCLTVGLVNPHDKQFFWAGIEGAVYQQQYKKAGKTAPVAYTGIIAGQSDPPDYGYQLPANWQPADALLESGVKLPRLGRDFFSYAMTGDVSDDPNQTDFTMAPTPVTDSVVPYAPFGYWTKALDMYTWAMNQVDIQIGQLIGNLPEDLAANTVIVFTSDHGEYASAHGLQGKGFSVYKECLNVPLIVVDPRPDGVVSAPDIIREQLASSVDLVPLLVSIARDGTEWMKEEPYKALYGTRARLLDILRDPGAPGRKYALYTTDEAFPASYNYLNAPFHAIGVVTEQGKLGTYAFWDPSTNGGQPLKAGLEVEYYDYTAPDGKLEMTSTADSPAAQELLHMLMTTLLPDELQAPLPEQYQTAQQNALDAYWRYVKGTDAVSMIGGRCS